MKSLGPPGPGRTLAFAYSILAIAAGARSAWQISTRLSEAPAPFLLSAAAAVLYAVLALTINRPERVAVALATLCVELAGVIVVGLFSLLLPGAFPDETVWSDFGAGYLFAPLALPLLGLGLLARRTEPKGSRTRPIRRRAREP